MTHPTNTMPTIATNSGAAGAPLLAGADLDGLLPHAGPMRLVASVTSWDDTRLHARLAAVDDVARHPLHVRDDEGRAVLPWTAALELAAQAMALHGGLAARGPEPASGGADAALPGYIAAVRAFESRVDRLDTLRGPLQVDVERLAGDRRQAVYAFVLSDADGQPQVSARVTVVLQGSR